MDELAGESFGCVVATQVLGQVRDYEHALTLLAALVNPGGRLIVVEGFDKPEQAAAFAAGCARCGLALGSSESLRFSDLGVPGEFPAFLFERRIA